MEIQKSENEKYSIKGDLEQLTKEQLISKVLQLEAHIKQLKNILKKTLEKDNNTQKDEKSGKRTFDFSKFNKRHVLLKFLYFGWDYQGYVIQEDTQMTIEHHLFKALQKTCLIEKRENSNYNRCGRTDKGVSAFSQVISIDLRSKFIKSEQMKSENILNEIDYCGILNRVLPENIKCISWKPLSNDLYSARFDCIQRAYRYFFPMGDLNIELMQEGCKFLIGTHDFRNLCKMDVANGVKTFIRNVSRANIKCCNFQNDENNGYTMYYLEIFSQAFLWHQIRCIMAVLILIGKGYEDPIIIKELLNVEKNPCKPQYNMTSGLPLNLYSCDFRNERIENNDLTLESNNTDNLEKWSYSKENLSKLLEDLQSKWSIQNVQVTMIREMIIDIEKLYRKHYPGGDVPKKQTDVFLPNKQKRYQSLLNRKRCESLENRLIHYEKKQRLMASNLESDQN